LRMIELKSHQIVIPAKERVRKYHFSLFGWGFP
jgi:hypothetical protein